MNMKKILAGVLACCVIGGALPYAGGKTADNAVITADAADEYTEGTYGLLSYKNYGDHIEISKCDESATSVVIPDKIDGVTVTSIGESSFKNCSKLKSVIIPESVTNIAVCAFMWCIKLEEIKIPENVTDIGAAAFLGCSSLPGINIPDNVTKIGDSTFRDCRALYKIDIPEGVTSIGSNAFSSCSNLRSITLPEGITIIDNYAFCRCSLLETITIPKSVTSIGESAFDSCSSIESITIPDGVTEISGYLFNGCSSLKSLTIPEGVTKIGWYAFSGCSSLIDLTIPKSVTSIQHYAFKDTLWLEEKQKENPLVIINNILIDATTCSGNVVIPENVVCINDYAFSECTELTGITIPDSVKDIHYKAFSGCTGLTEITIPENIEIINNYVFSGCTGLTEINIPKNVKEIGTDAFSGCTGLTEVTIPKNVAKIGDNAFWGCKGLKSIIVENPFCIIYYSEYAQSALGHTNVIYGYENSLAHDYAEYFNREFVALPRPKLNYQITEAEADKCNIALCTPAKAEIEYSTINNDSSIFGYGSKGDKLQECKDSKGNIYAVYGYKNSVTLFSENTDIKSVTIENDGFTFGAAIIDENDNLYIFWGYNLTEYEKNTENLVIMKYDLNGNVLGRCGIPILTSDAKYPFDAGNANMAVNNNIIGCFFDTRWTNGHQGSEFAAIDKNTMELITFYDWQGSHSFGVSLMATDFGFVGIQKGDMYGRGINFNSYLISDNQIIKSYFTLNGRTAIFNASGQYNSDGNYTYLHMGGLTKSATTYAVAGKSERVYSSMEYYRNSDLRTNNFDVFLKISDQTLADTASDLAGEERVDVETGETANYNIVWLTECNETEKAGLVKVVTLADGSYCVLWEKFVNEKFDSIRYVITDECGNILRHETGIYGARLSDTSVQPIVEGYTLKWAVADAENKCVNFYTVDLNDFSIADIKGDVNCDGKVNAADAVLLQKWLLAVPDTKLLNWKAADLCADDKLDAFDMIEMRKLIIKNK